MAEDIVKIEINFPGAVELTNDDLRQLDAVAGEICDRYQTNHPGRIMWPAGIGSKITYMPMTREEELAGRHLEFDDSIFAIDCAERADYDWPCARCGKPQGDHKDHILDPPAGECEFAPAMKEPAAVRALGLVPMHVYLSAVRGRSEMRQSLREARERIKALEACIAPNEAAQGDGAQTKTPAP